MSADSLALADFARVNAVRRAADLGCGCGILMLLLAFGQRSLAVDGVEIRPGAAAQCRKNLEINALTDRCAVVQADLRAGALSAESYELVVTNPPYFSPGRGRVSPDGERARMRTESATLAELSAAAAALLIPGGRFCLVHRMERKAELFRALEKAGLSPVRFRALRSRQERPGRVFLLESRKGESSPLREEPPLCQYGPDGTETAEYRKICHWEA